MVYCQVNLTFLWKRRVSVRKQIFFVFDVISGQPRTDALLKNQQGWDYPLCLGMPRYLHNRLRISGMSGCAVVRRREQLRKKVLELMAFPKVDPQPERREEAQQLHRPALVRQGMIAVAIDNPARAETDSTMRDLSGVSLV